MELPFIFICPIYIIYLNIPPPLKSNSKSTIVNSFLFNILTIKLKGKIAYKHKTCKDSDNAFKINYCKFRITLKGGVNIEYIIFFTIK